MPNPWVIAALAGFSVVAFFVYLSELDQPPLAPPHYQHTSSGGSNQSNRTSARDANNGNSKKNDGDDDDGKSDSERDKGDRTAEQATAATVTSSGAHRFPGSVGSGSMMVRRRSRTISAGSRQESPTTTPERSSPPPPAYTPTLPSTSHLSEPPIELQPLHSSPPAATTAASSHDHQEALALASELEDTERQLQALLVKREQLALRQSQIDLRELAAQAAAAAQQTSPPSPPTSSTTSGLFDAPSPFAASPGDQEDGGMTELDKMRDTSVVLESEPGSSSVSESLVSVPPVQVSADHASAENEPVSPSTSGFDSLTSRSEATSDDGKGDLTAVVETTATAAGEDEPEADARSESEYSLVSAGSA